MGYVVGETYEGLKVCESVFALGNGSDSVLLAVSPDYIAVRRVDRVIMSNPVKLSTDDRQYIAYTKIDIDKEVGPSNIVLGVARVAGRDQNVLFNLTNACRIFVSRIPDIDNPEDVRDEEVWYILPKNDIVTWIY